MPPTPPPRVVPFSLLAEPSQEVGEGWDFRSWAFSGPKPTCGESWLQFLYPLISQSYWRSGILQVSLSAVESALHCVFSSMP